MAEPAVFRCIAPGCTYQMWDASLEDANAHWQEHLPKAAPASKPAVVTTSRFRDPFGSEGTATHEAAVGPLHRGDRVVVGARRTVLIVWEDLGRGVQVTSEDGYRRAVAGDPEAPIVGLPRHDIVALAPETS